MVLVIALLFALVILMTLLHQARGELNAHPPSSNLRWIVVSIQILTVFTLRQSGRKPGTMTQVGQFLPVPFIIYLTPVQNFLRLFESDIAIGFALVVAFTLIVYSYTALLSMKPRQMA